MKKILIITALLIFTNLANANPDLEEATKDVCACLEEPHNKARQAVELIKKAQASGDISQIMVAQGEMMGVISASTRCFDRLPDKYPEIDKSDALKNRVMEMAEKKCPNPVSELSMK